MSKYETILEEIPPAPGGDEYVAVEHEKHNTTIDKYSGNDYERHNYYGGETTQVSKDVFAQERSYNRDREYEGRYYSSETIEYVPPSIDRYEIDEILKRYESRGIDTTINRSYQRASENELHSASSNITFGYNEDRGGADSIDRILSKYESEKIRIAGNSQYVSGGYGSRSRGFERIEDRRTRDYQPDEPIVIFTENRKIGKKSRVNSRQSDKTSQHISYEDLRARLHHDE